MRAEEEALADIKPVFQKEGRAQIGIEMHVQKLDEGIEAAAPGRIVAYKTLIPFAALPVRKGVVEEVVWENKSNEIGIPEGQKPGIGSKVLIPLLPEGSDAGKEFLVAQ